MKLEDIHRLMDNELVLSGFPAIGWFHADDVTSMHQDKEKSCSYVVEVAVSRLVHR